MFETVSLGQVLLVGTAAGLLVGRRELLLWSRFAGNACGRGIQLLREARWFVVDISEKLRERAPGNGSAVLAESLSDINSIGSEIRGEIRASSPFTRRIRPRPTSVDSNTSQTSQPSTSAIRPESDTDVHHSIRVPQSNPSEHAGSYLLLQTMQQSALLAKHARLFPPSASPHTAETAKPGD
mmetsp:Transcript_6250/g.12387  ORF Transcript_6250/g.12387 Transcript_6250/m.12387 type:complete len:182 (-) Transcript_6250:36-581(-)